MKQNLNNWKFSKNEEKLKKTHIINAQKPVFFNN